jgi:hypothetical protein
MLCPFYGSAFSALPVTINACCIFLKQAAAL